MRKLLLAIIDFFYPPFKKFMSLHNFRYLATGGGTLVLGVLVYYIGFYWVFTTEEVPVFGLVFKRETAALFLDNLVVIPTSFLLNRYVIFTQSELKWTTQLFRFLNLQWINILMSYVLLKGFVDFLHIWPTIAKVVSSILLAIFSYLYQHYFTFSVKKLGKRN